jgi:hypothetical protein
VKEYRFEVERLRRGRVEGMTGTAFFGGDAGGAEESLSCGVRAGAGIACAALAISDVGGSSISGLGGSGTGWDRVSIVPTTDLPLDLVREENH